MTAFTLLIVLALGLTVAAFIWPKPYLTHIALLLICIALLIGQSVRLGG